jgi:hypothetical protein
VDGQDIRRALAVVARVLNEGEHTHPPDSPQYWLKVGVARARQARRASWRARGDGFKRRRHGASPSQALSSRPRWNCRASPTAAMSAVGAVAADPRTQALMNQMRCLLGEFGIVVAQGPARLRRAVAVIQEERRMSF